MIGRIFCLVLTLLALAGAEPVEDNDSKKACRGIACYLLENCQNLDRARVKWYIGVDCSRSMVGKLDPAKRVLMAFLTNVVVDEEEVQVHRFGAELGESRNFQRKAPDLSWLELDPSGSTGSAVDQCKEELRLAAGADGIVLIVSDRDNSDQVLTQRALSGWSSYPFSCTDESKRKSVELQVLCYIPKLEAGTLVERKVPYRWESRETTPEDTGRAFRQVLPLVGPALILIALALVASALLQPVRVLVTGRQLELPWNRPLAIPCTSQEGLNPRGPHVHYAEAVRLEQVSLWRLARCQVRLSACDSLILENPHGDRSSQEVRLGYASPREEVEVRLKRDGALVCDGKLLLEAPGWRILGPVVAAILVALAATWFFTLPWIESKFQKPEEPRLIQHETKRLTDYCQEVRK